MQPQALAFAFAQRTQTGSLTQSAVVERGCIFRQQHPAFGRHTALGLLSVRRQEAQQTDVGTAMFNQPVSTFGWGPPSEAAMESGLRLFPPRLQNGLSPAIAPLVAQIQGLQLPLKPVAVG